MPGAADDGAAARNVARGVSISPLTQHDASVLEPHAGHTEPLPQGSRTKRYVRHGFIKDNLRV